MNEELDANEEDESASNELDAPITDLDLAAYAQGLLSATRRKKVERLLEDNPDLSFLAAPILSSSSPSNIPLDSESSSHDLSGDDVVEPVTDERKNNLVPSRNIRKIVSRSLAFVTASFLVTASVFMFARQSLADRISRFEIRLQQQSQDIGTTNLHQLQLELLALGKSMFLSDSIDRRRRMLLSRLYLLQLKSDIALLQFGAGSGLGDSTIDQCNDLIDLIQVDDGQTQEETELLSETYLVKSRLIYLLGSIAEDWDNRVDRMQSASLAALTAIELLENLPRTVRERLYVPAAALLLRSLYKGGIVRGIGPAANIHARCNELRGRSPDHSIDSLVPELTAQFLTEPTTTAEAKIARIDFYSVAGMWAANIQHQGTQDSYGLNIYQTGTAEVDQLIQNAEFAASPEFLLMSGKLYGNQADFMTILGRPDQAIAARNTAIQLLRKSLAERSSNVTMDELGWVTCRQLFIEYVTRRQRNQDLIICHRLLGATMTLSDDLKDFSGMQLGLSEQALIPIIAADLLNDASLLPSNEDTSRMLEGQLDPRPWAIETISEAAVLLEAPDLRVTIKNYLARSRAAQQVR